MPVFEEYVRDRREEADQARGDAEGHLISQLDNADSITEAVATVALTRAVAVWWATAVNAIDREGLDPADAGRLVS
jgi:hypothetical protein